MPAESRTDDIQGEGQQLSHELTTQVEDMRGATEPQCTPSRCQSGLLLITTQPL